MVTMVTDTSANAWIIDENAIYFPAIDAIDTGIANNLGTLSPSVPYGTVVRAKHATFGEGEFIYLQGVVGNFVGALVTYSPTTGVATLTTTSGAAIPLPVAVSMSASVLTTTFGWYQISGSAVVKKTATKIDPAAGKYPNVYLSATAGRVMPTSVAGRCVLGAGFASTTTVTTTTSTAVVTLNRPHQQGPIT